MDLKPDTHNEKAEISLKNISFKYSLNDDYVINNFSLDIMPNKFYGLVGLNGAGKSTLINIMLGLYKAQHGQVLYGAGISQSILPIFQDYCNYPISIRDYILLGNTDKVDDEDIIHTLETLGLKDKIQGLENGLDTKLMLTEENSTILSGGQQQKLLVARALLSPCNIIILDEPTAKLDPIAEREIFELYMELLKDKTLILSTHRLAAIKACDEIIVIDKGYLVEKGSHELLMEKGTLYSRLFKAQRSMYE